MVVTKWCTEAKWLYHNYYYKSRSLRFVLKWCNWNQTETGALLISIRDACSYNNIKCLFGKTRFEIVKCQNPNTCIQCMFICSLIICLSCFSLLPFHKIKGNTWLILYILQGKASTVGFFYFLFLLLHHAAHLGAHKLSTEVQVCCWSGTAHLLALKLHT